MSERGKGLLASLLLLAGALLAVVAARALLSPVLAVGVGLVVLVPTLLAARAIRRRWSPNS
jgi:hypothetical protein